VPQFLTAEWVEAFNRAVADLRLPPPGEGAGLVARGGRFVVAQRVHDAPGGAVTLLLALDEGRVRLSLEPAGTHEPEGQAAPSGTAEDRRLVDEPMGSGPGPGASARADVTVALSYADAAAMARGELTPAEALAAGRVRVRGDLSVLVAGQQVLAEARRLVQGLAEATSF